MTKNEYTEALREWMSHIIEQDDDTLWEVFGEVLRDIEQIQANTLDLREQDDKDILDYTIKELAKRRSPLYKAIKGEDE